MTGLRLFLNIQSLSDIVTNSSSEVFCEVVTVTGELLDQAAKYLSTILDRKVEVVDYSADNKKIEFWIEWGDDDSTVKEDFRKLIKHILDKEFGPGVFIVREGEY